MKNKNLSLLLAGQLVSQVGDKFHMIAISFWVLETTGSSAKMGAVLAASLVPSLILGFFSGTFIDRYNRKAIIIRTDLLRGLIILLFALLMYSGHLNFYTILLMQVLLSVNAAFFDPAIPAVIPQIVKRNEIAAANSKHQFVNGFATIAGAFLGGIAVSVFGFMVVFMINALSFLASACFEAFIDLPHVKEKTEQESSILKEIKQGYTYILTNRVFVVLLFMVMVIHFFVGSIAVFMPVIASLISADGPETLGFFQAAFGLGMIISAGYFNFRTISEKEKAALFTSVFLIGVLFVVASIIPSSGNFIVLYFCTKLFLLGGCIICASIAFRSLLQKKIDNKFAGRVFAVAGSVGNASIPGAMIVYGFLLEKYSFQYLLMISGLALMPLSIAAYGLYKEEKDATKVFTKPVP